VTLLSLFTSGDTTGRGCCGGCARHRAADREIKSRLFMALATAEYIALVVTKRAHRIHSRCRPSQESPPPEAAVMGRDGVVIGLVLTLAAGRA